MSSATPPTPSNASSSAALTAAVCLFGVPFFRPPCFGVPFGTPIFLLRSTLDTRSHRHTTPAHRRLHYCQLISRIVLDELQERFALGFRGLLPVLLEPCQWSIGVFDHPARNRRG